MSRYPRNRFILISPPELEIPDYIISRVFKPAGVQFTQVRRMEEAIGDLDILYMTRVQKERFFNEQDYIRLKDSYILDAEKMKRAKSDLCVLHPLPRVNEIAIEVDSDPRAAYFKQVKFGMYARMALIAALLGVEGSAKAASNIAAPDDPANAPAGVSAPVAAPPEKNSGSASPETTQRHGLFPHKGGKKK